MKRAPQMLQILLFTLLVLGLVGLPWAQEQHEQQIGRKGVPAAVLAAFEKAYPNAKIKGYSKETDNGQLVYEVECVEGAVTRDVTFTADGTLVAIEESGWHETESGTEAAFGNCMGWSQMLCALKAWVEHGINLREGMYK